MRKIAVLLTLPLVAVLLLGCSGGGSQSDEEAIEDVISDFGEAFNDGDAKGLIALIDSESRKNCNEAQLAPMLALVKAFTEGAKFTAEASDIKVNGNRATAMITAGIGDDMSPPEQQELIKEDGKWKLLFEGGQCDLE